MAQVKEGGMLNTHPQLTVKGVGFDRTLGGLEMDIRLRDHLAKQFEVRMVCAHIMHKHRILLSLFLFVTVNGDCKQPS